MLSNTILVRNPEIQKTYKKPLYNKEKILLFLIFFLLLLLTNRKVNSEIIIKSICTSIFK
jgi:hypothetical protein